MNCPTLSWLLTHAEVGVHWTGSEIEMWMHCFDMMTCLNSVIFNTPFLAPLESSVHTCYKISNIENPRSYRAHKPVKQEFYSYISILTLVL